MYTPQRVADDDLGAVHHQHILDTVGLEIAGKGGGRWSSRDILLDGIPGIWSKVPPHLLHHCYYDGLLSMKPLALLVDQKAVGKKDFWGEA